MLRAGTYIRSLARDIGVALGTAAHLKDTSSLASLTPDVVDFGTVAQGRSSKTREIKLQLPKSASRVSVTIATPTPSAGFLLDATNTTCKPAHRITPGSACTVGLKFTPSSTGAIIGSLTINFNEPAPPRTVALKGPGGSQN